MAQGINPTLHTAGLAALETALNRALALTPGGAGALAELDRQVFALHCTAPTVDVYLQPADGEVRLMGVYDGPVTTSIRGEASDFAELASSTDAAATLINGNLELRGDSAALIDLQKSLSTLEFDWEAPLVESLGDVTGHQMATLLRGAFSWSRQAATSLSRQLEEFIHEEARLSPPRLELEDFYGDVRELDLRVERLASRVQRVRRKLRSLTGRG